MFGNILKAAINTALLPVAAVADVVGVLDDESDLGEHTCGQVGRIVENLEDALDDVFE